MPCRWNRFVANPIKNYGYEGKGRSAMLLLKNTIMPTILLRRTKLQVQGTPVFVYLVGDGGTPRLRPEPCWGSDAYKRQSFLSTLSH